MTRRREVPELQDGARAGTSDTVLAAYGSVSGCMVARRLRAGGRLRVAVLELTSRLRGWAREHRAKPHLAWLLPCSPVKADLLARLLELIRDSPDPRVRELLRGLGDRLER